MNYTNCSIWYYIVVVLCNYCFQVIRWLHYFGIGCARHSFNSPLSVSVSVFFFTLFCSVAALFWSDLDESLILMAGRHRHHHRVSLRTLDRPLPRTSRPGHRQDQGHDDHQVVGHLLGGKLWSWVAPGLSSITRFQYHQDDKVSREKTFHSAAKGSILTIAKNLLKNQGLSSRVV